MRGRMPPSLMQSIGKNNRARGHSAERELFHKLSDDLGVRLRRSLVQSRDSGCDSTDLAHWSVECKYTREASSRPKWYAQCVAAAAALEQERGHVVHPIVFYRHPHAEWRAVVAVEWVCLGDRWLPAGEIEHIRGGQIIDISYRDAVRLVREVGL